MEPTSSPHDLAVIPTSSLFLDSEISEMENLFRDIGKHSLNQEFCEELATNFSSSPSHVGKPALTWQQVQNWFKGKYNDSPNNSIVLKGGTAEELSELAFEARSSRDRAWYDVGAFLNYRVLYTGELEARVRFAGFSSSHDEWVNVRHGIRERSIPLEPSECHKVKVGDNVLCFQERPEYAVYADAHVTEIQRRLHDIKGCRCIFVVRFDDRTEEKVELSKICCRPQ